jgi:C-terminal processing protease CtpA/Prc
MMRLSGQPGTPVALLIARKGVDEPFTITMRRVAVRQ